MPSDTDTRSPDEVFESIEAAFLDHYPEGDPGPLRSAFGRARSLHEGQHRRTGEEFIMHPLAVTELLAAYGLDRDTLIAALLHDTVEDTGVSLTELETEYGVQVAALIDGVTKLDRIDFHDPATAQAATIRKMVIAMADDIRVLIIKLADRLHNVRTLAPFSDEKQQRIARETLDVYAPLANRMGMQEVMHELEDRCFSVLHPRRSAEINAQLRRRAPAREGVIEAAVKELTAALESAGLKTEIKGRPKHRYSIYRKMIEDDKTFDEIHDLLGIRVITKDVKDCYAALGVVHTLWAPLHGRFKDYIATPKFNLYQSLHTTVIGPGGKPLEVQIRSEEMHARAERGVAAHWSYKEGESAAWMPDISFLRETFADPAEFLAGLKIELYRDEVFAVTPMGKVVTLPVGATPVDFAYAIHTEVGHACVGAKVNGRLVPLNTELKSGDIVEITTSRSPQAHPSRDWLKFTQTSRATAKIRQWFNRERRQEALASGKEDVAAALAREALGLSSARRDRLLEDVAHQLSYQDLDALYVAVGESNVSAQTVIGRLGRLLEPDRELQTETDDLIAPPRPKRAVPLAPAIEVEGHADLAVRIPGCCAPVPGDEIVGFVTVGGGVTVHRTGCSNVADLSARAERMVQVSWAADRVGSFVVWLQVESLDRPGLLRDVTSVLSDMDGNIHASSSVTGKDRVAILRYEVEFSDPGQLNRALEELRQIDGVYDAYRLAASD
jgi:GTP pyrophosphokinase